MSLISLNAVPRFVCIGNAMGFHQGDLHNKKESKIITCLLSVLANFGSVDSIAKFTTIPTEEVSQFMDVLIESDLVIQMGCEYLLIDEDLLSGGGEEDVSYLEHLEDQRKRRAKNAKRVKKRPTNLKSNESLCVLQGSSCAVCLSDSIENPSVLDCGHVFCGECCSHMEKYEGITCPKCRVLSNKCKRIFV